ncbi:unnamed protein product, partial [Medioppia subpectinata]
MISGALANGQLKPNGPIVEMTSGNTGAGLAVIAAVMGHPLTLTMSAGCSAQRAVMMRALGANLMLAPQVEGSPGKVSWLDVCEALRLAERVSGEQGAFYVDQFNNTDNTRGHVETTGPEIWRQTGGRVDAFVAHVGSAGAYTGVSRYLKSQSPDVKCFVAEPAGAEAVKGLPITKPVHMLQGSGFGNI